ncbi:unnamed protein product [Notodromas monacha]|uniref:TEP1-F n=1 Tax=Notodromas monacha TaxID=399045 RepID=A0A7R9BHU7_9CRUS|nr:unnamed protein product [Notodromas monacha]CAG0914373.1 unnamed protein product [Notodromas monacha]
MCARSIQLKCLHCLGILVIVVAFVAAQTRNGIYTVVAPKALRPNTDYHVAVSIHDSPDPVFVTVEIDGIQDSGGRIHSQKQQQIDSSDTRILQFPMGDLGQGSYNISVSGTGGVRFSNTTTLEYVRKSLSVFIQTDKAIYKPGQKVMFRAIVVDRKLRPSATTRIDVFVSDGKQNRVKQFKRAFTNRGVFSGEVELSDQPVLGDWNITVTVLGQEFSKTFKVAEYILPKFEVDIDLPPFATFRNSEVTAVITARYTYGKPVKGEATVSVSPLYKSPYLQPFYDEPLHKVASIDGRTTVKFNLAEELKLTDDFQREILFDVTVEEALTGRRQNTSGTVKLFKYPYKLELIKMADAFKPGLKYSAFLKVANQDDTPIQDAVGKVIVRHGFSYNQDDFESNEHWIPANGLIPLSFSPPATDDVHVLSIEAEYKDLRELLTTVVRAQSPSNTYIQADLKTEHPKENVIAELESYDSGKSEADFPLMMFKRRKRSALWPGSATAADVFQEAGVIVLTNGYVHEAKQFVYYRSSGFDDVDNRLLMSASANAEHSMLEDVDDIVEDSVSPDSHSHRPRLRRNFAETWLWNTLETGLACLNLRATQEEDLSMGSQCVFFDAGFSSTTETPNRVDSPLSGGGGGVGGGGGSGLSAALSPTRPPLAGPFAFSRIPRPVDARPRFHVKRDFADTWLFHDLTLRYSLCPEKGLLLPCSLRR